MSGPDPAGPQPAAAAFAELRRDPVVLALLAACGPTECHLVGGALRDRALGLVTHDLDAVVAGRGHEIAGALAARLPARLVLLGGRHFAAYRLVLTAAGGGPREDAGDGGAGRQGVLDLWDRQSTPLQEDLARRDFTVNSFALEPRGGEVIDPYGGLADLARRSLRATTRQSFEGDPLRVLRLARLLVRLPGFAVEPETRQLARRTAPRLAEVAAERIREELWLLLSHQDAGRGLLELAALDLYPDLWLGHPGGAATPTRPGTGVAAGGEAATAAERAAAEIAALPARAGELRRWLGTGAAEPSTAPDATAASSTAYAADAIHAPDADVDAAAAPNANAGAGADAAATPDTDALPPIDFTAARFAATFRHLPAVDLRPPAAALSHMRDAGYLSVRQAAEIAPLLAQPAELPATEVGRRRFLHRHGRRWLTAATSFGAAAAAAGPESLDRWRRAASPLCELARREGPALIAPPRLLGGEDVQRLLEVPAGPRVGAALAALTEAQVDGTVRTRDGAERFLRGWRDRISG
jgi:hypothetical protein